MLTKKFELNLSLILLHEGFDGGGRLFGLEWTMQRNDQLPEENQTRGTIFLRDMILAMQWVHFLTYSYLKHGKKQ